MVIRCLSKCGHQWSVWPQTDPRVTSYWHEKLTTSNVRSKRSLKGSLKRGDFTDLSDFRIFTSVTFYKKSKSDPAKIQSEKNFLGGSRIFLLKFLKPSFWKYQRRKLMLGKIGKIREIRATLIRLDRPSLPRSWPWPVTEPPWDDLKSSFRPGLLSDDGRRDGYEDFRDEKRTGTRTANF